MSYQSQRCSGIVVGGACHFQPPRAHCLNGNLAESINMIRLPLFLATPFPPIPFADPSALRAGVAGSGKVATTQPRNITSHVLIPAGTGTGCSLCRPFRAFASGRDFFPLPRCPALARYSNRTESRALTLLSF